MNTFLDATLALLVVMGAGFALVGSLGLARLSDFLKRIHGPTKATTLGVGCVLLASIGWFAWRGTVALNELLITLFLFLTAPVSAHLLIKAAMRQDPSLRPPPVPPHPAAPGPGADASPAAGTESRPPAR